jgi:hypothetical protein
MIIGVSHQCPPQENFQKCIQLDGIENRAYQNLLHSQSTAKGGICGKNAFIRKSKVLLWTECVIPNSSTEASTPNVWH